MLFLKLIRLPNLLLIALTQYLVWSSIILVSFRKIGLDSAFSDMQFIMIVLATVFVAAGGYIINDIHDIKIDRVNKPDFIIVEKKISTRVAYLLYIVFTTLALGLSFIVLKEIGLLDFYGVFIGIVVFLFLYSFVLKKVVFLSNFIVAIMVALVPLLIGVLEYVKLSDTEIMLLGDTPIYWVLGFSIFAFLLNMAREIVKDMEDVRGDLREHRKTIPIVFGFGFAKKTALVFVALTMGFVVVLIFNYFMSFLSFILTVSVLLFPLSVAFLLISFARKFRQYTISSLVLKIIMFFGLVFLGFARFLMN